MKMGSLFAGIGGIELGFKNGWGAGFETAWGIEIDSRACETYMANHKNKIINNDLANVNLNELCDIDILCAGFPCQAFSVAGYRLGFNDARGNVFFEILRYLRHFKPSIIFLENVKNLRGHDGGRTFTIIKNELENLGYKLKYEVLNTATHGNLPQNRERIYIVGFLDSAIFDNFSFPKPLPLNTKIAHLLDKEVSHEFYYTNHKYFQKMSECIHDENTIYQWRRHYVRENKNKLCPTLTANMGTGGHNVPLILCKENTTKITKNSQSLFEKSSENTAKNDSSTSANFINSTGKIRKLTPRECARFQGFKDDFILPHNLSNSTLYKQIGNSVSISVIERIAKEIKKAMFGTDLAMAKEELKCKT